MPRTSQSLAATFRDIVDRMIAALHQQRAIEARRVLRRYRHLLDPQQEATPSKQVISIRNEEDTTKNAHQSDARERAASDPSLEHA
jgi:hypothetical protein